ncbi:MAG TPA: VOC family protein [Nitrososphaera sp.]|nr:VOC family protein [Nitrososphaera sp.]
MAKKKKAKPKKRVSPVPKGYHTITPGLAVRNAAEAIDFYKKALGAKEKMRMPGPDGKVMHAELQIGDSSIMLGEENVQMNHLSPLSLNGSPVGLYVYVSDADKVFDQAIRVGATAAMPMMDQFWGDRAGMITDPFGHKWWIATHRRNLTPKEMKKSAEEWFAQQAQQQQIAQA